MSWVDYIATLTAPSPSPGASLVKLQLCCGGHRCGKNRPGWPVSDPSGEGGGTVFSPWQATEKVREGPLKSRDVWNGHTDVLSPAPTCPRDHRTWITWVPASCPLLSVHVHKGTGVGRQHLAGALAQTEGRSSATRWCSAYTRRITERYGMWGSGLVQSYEAIGI